MVRDCMMDRFTYRRLSANRQALRRNLKGISIHFISLHYLVFTFISYRLF